MNRGIAAKRFVVVVGGVALLIGCFTALHAQRRFRRMFQDSGEHQRVVDQSEFVFVRIQFGSGRGGFGGYGGWAHDFPDAEEHILQVTQEATDINSQKMAYIILNLEDEAVFRYPFIYFSEVGEMNMSEREVEILREYFNRGGFAMVDDFYGEWEFDNFKSEMRRVFPERNFVELSIEHPIFHTFYDIPKLEATGLSKPGRSRSPATYHGYYDDKGRLLMIINHDNDLGDFWEWIDQPMYPLAPSTEALRLGVNYFIYSMTH
jgi:hypothetical protein